uniref:Uncharacterized protein n=1 Tax=Bradyrhizobium amphicarpaeae TaxID=1404768 RepID=A0A2U8PR37_9BRAD|nr:hypothetical protein CIT40_09450 [Bradyrhizobium amphicarpaeae]
MSFHSVMAGLDPAIHVLLAARRTWMPGTSPGMTTSNVANRRTPWTSNTPPVRWSSSSASASSCRPMSSRSRISIMSR